MKSENRRLVIEWTIRLVALGLVWAAVAIWRPGILGGFSNSPRAITVIIGGFVLLVVIEWWLRRRGRPQVGRMVFYSLLIVGIIAAVIPSFINRTVNEQESSAFQNAQTSPTTAAPNPSSPSAAEPNPSPTTAPTGPVELGRAEVVGIDHRASGIVRVVQDASGKFAVRFENLDVEPGPDYYVWLVPGADRQTPDGGTNLGRIKANKGNQEYQATADFTANPPVTVLIWCRAFAVPVANATIG